MVEIIFEAHGTTFDNEAGKASGWNAVDLSPLGVTQAKELGERYSDKDIDAVFTSDLKRAIHTAKIAFGEGKIQIITDERLRECNYGTLTNSASSKTESLKGGKIELPFPEGESYQMTNERMKPFLKELLGKFDGKRVLIIGHRATQYGLESLVLGKDLKSVVMAPWKWQPGWQYLLKEI